MFDAFNAGIEPGGLRNKNDIRILICYMLSSVNAPLAAKDITDILVRYNIVNYFEANDALSALEEQKNISLKDGIYSIEPAGRTIAQTLDTSLPLSVRDKVLQATINLMARAKAERENRVDVNAAKNGFNVTCHISDRNNDLMKIELFVPDKKQAEIVKNNFHADPQGIYKLLLAGLTGDEELIKSFFE